jgi:superfamily II DNA or RNA helicase
VPAGVNENAIPASPLYDAAQRLIDGGCVLDVRVLQAGCVVTGVVGDEPSSGAGGIKHRVYIRRPAVNQAERLQGRDLDDPRIEAECSCAERSLCAHIAAVSIAATSNARVSMPGTSRPTAGATPLSRPDAVATDASSSQRLVYLFQRSEKIQLSIWVGQSASRSERTREDTVCLFAPRSSHGANEFPRYVNAQDRGILAGLFAQQADGPWQLQGAAGARLLQQAVATGSAFWRSLHGQALRSGSSRRVHFLWQTLPNGDQELRCEAADAIEIALDVQPAMYIDSTTSELGLLELPCALELLRRYWNQPAIRPELIASVNEQLAREAEASEFPRLQTLALQPQPFSSLKAKLVLSAGPEATLYFVYNGLPVDSRYVRGHQATVRKMADDVLYEIPRDRATEEVLRARLDRVLPKESSSSTAWLAFMLEQLPALQAEGWDMEVQAGFPYRLAAADDWYMDAQTDRQPEWFNLRLGIVVAGQHINLLPALTRYLQTSMPTAEDPSCCQIGEQWLVRLEDGRYLPIALERIRRIAATLVELFDHSSLNAQQALTLPKSQSSRLAQITRELNGPKLQSADESLRALIADLDNFSGIQPLSAPANFGAELRPYQEEGLGWLQFLRRYRLGGILADDMGLGKTVQALAHLALEKAQGRLHQPSLIVAPVSVIGNWQQEIARFAPGLRLLTLHGSRRKESFPLIGQADVVVTGYPLLQFDAEILQAHEFYFLILDEAQTIKNSRAKVSQAARALRSEHRLCLTGTPVENHLGELWSLFDFLQPGLLGEERYFQRHYRTPIEKNGHDGRAQALSQRVAPFLLRRTKDSVAKELPAKMEIVEAIVLEEKQRDFYDGIRLAMHRHLQEVIQEQGLARSQITILDALLKLRQACCDPRLTQAGAAQEGIPSAKLDWLTTALPELVAEGRRILLFSQFTSMLRLIEEAVTALSIPYCLLTGETKHRSAEVARFQSGAVPLFLISLKAGGTGLNLTAADTVIHYDPWWNPAVEAQATDRAHRIGQDKPVFVYKLIAQGTVEEKMLQLQSAKSALVSQLYAENTASPRSLSAADLELLFA